MYMFSLHGRRKRTMTTTDSKADFFRGLVSAAGTMKSTVIFPRETSKVKVLTWVINDEHNVVVAW
jgi:hypothetical protein